MRSLATLDFTLSSIQPNSELIMTQFNFVTFSYQHWSHSTTLELLQQALHTIIYHEIMCADRMTGKITQDLQYTYSILLLKSTGFWLALLWSWLYRRPFSTLFHIERKYLWTHIQSKKGGGKGETREML